MLPPFRKWPGPSLALIPLTQPVRTAAIPSIDAGGTTLALLDRVSIHVRFWRRGCQCSGDNAKEDERYLHVVFVNRAVCLRLAVSLDLFSLRGMYLEYLDSAADIYWVPTNSA